MIPIQGIKIIKLLGFKETIKSDKNIDLGSNKYFSFVLSLAKKNGEFTLIKDEEGIPIGVKSLYIFDNKFKIQQIWSKLDKAYQFIYKINISNISNDKQTLVKVSFDIANLESSSKEQEGFITGEYCWSRSSCIFLFR